MVINTPDGDASADWTKGSIDLAELVDPEDPLAKRDEKFQAMHPLFVYYKAAHAHQRIMETGGRACSVREGIIPGPNRLG